MDYIKTWKEIILRPSDFYKRMPTAGGYADPLTFVAICHLINVLMFIFVRPSLLTLVGLHDPRLNFSILSTVILMPIIGIVSVFIMALIFNLLYKVFGGTGSYEGTVKFLSYASAPTILTWIPIIGLIAGIYGMYLYIIGGMVVHNVSMKKSTILVLPFALLALFYGVRVILSSFAH